MMILGTWRISTTRSLIALTFGKFIEIPTQHAMRKTGESSELQGQIQSPYLRRRAAARASEQLVSTFYNAGGALDSQTTDSQYVSTFFGEAAFSSPQKEVVQSFPDSFGASARDIQDILAELRGARREVEKLEDELVRAVLETVNMTSPSNLEPLQAPDVVLKTPRACKTRNCSYDQKGVCLDGLKTPRTCRTHEEVIPETPESQMGIAWESGESQITSDPYIASVESQQYRNLVEGFKEYKEFRRNNPDIALNSWEQ